MIYKSLFNINFHHAYFLDEGEKIFSAMTDEEKKKSVPLKKYMVSDYLRIAPTIATMNAIKGYRLLFKLHPQGFRIIAKEVRESVSGDIKYSPIITLPDDLTFTFGLYSTDSYFENYTEINPRKENTFYLFSNVRPDNETNIFTTDDSSIDLNFLLTEESSRKLTYTIASEDVFFSDSASRFSIANIDPEAIDKPANVKQLENYIQIQKNKGLIGFVRLSVKGDTTHDDLLELDTSDPNNIKQYVLNAPLEFTLNFKNRATLWRYIKTSENLVMTTSEEKPLTLNGCVEIEKQDVSPEPQEDYYFPNPTPENIKKESQNYYSEVFI